MSFTNLVMTNVSVCDGYEDKMAVTFHTSKDGQQKYANFKVAQRVYDSSAKDDYRYNNWRIKCVGSELVEKIKRMGIKGGSFVDIVGAELDMEKFTYDGKEFNVPVLKIRNVNNIRYSDIITSEKKNSTEKPVEPDRVVDIAESGFFKNLPTQVPPQMPQQPVPPQMPQQPVPPQMPQQPVPPQTIQQSVQQQPILPQMMPQPAPSQMIPQPVPSQMMQQPVPQQPVQSQMIQPAPQQSVPTQMMPLPVTSQTMAPPAPQQPVTTQMMPQQMPTQETMQMQSQIFHEQPDFNFNRIDLFAATT